MNDKSIIASYSGALATAISDTAQAPMWLTYTVGSLTAIYTLLKIIGWCIDRWRNRYDE